MAAKKRIDKQTIAPDASVRVKNMGHITEIMHSQKVSFGGCISKLNKDFFLDHRTGEIREFVHYKTREDGVDSIVKSLVRLRDILNTNVVAPEKCRWLTLTYAENMVDRNKLKWDFKNFNCRCRAKFGHYEYIAVTEPQGRGAWHLHVVLIFSYRAPYMGNAELAKIWGKGFVNIRRLENVDNVGVYLTAYLGDMELSDYQNLNPEAHTGEIKEVEFEENGEMKRKMFVKGARLSMYPPGCHLFYCSRGIKRPEAKWMTYQDAQKDVEDSVLTYSSSIEIKNADFVNQYTYEYYNRLRKKKEMD